MKRAIAAAALVVLANGIVLLAAGRERSAPATLTAIDVCTLQLVGGAGSDDPPALRLLLAPAPAEPASGLDAAGLRALGFSDSSIAAVGRMRDSTFRAPWERPAWVRLRQRDDSMRQFAVVEVAGSRERLAADSLSIVVRGLVALRERWEAPRTPMGEHDHAAMARGYSPGVITPMVIEVIPSLLHLSREQIAALRQAAPDSGGCLAGRQALIATGRSGGVWVEGLR